MNEDKTTRDILEGLYKRAQNMIKLKAENSFDKRQGINQALKDIEALVMPENPYPENIFIEPTKEQYVLFHKILQKHGLTLDKFAGAIGRQVWKGFINEIQRRLGL